MNEIITCVTCGRTHQVGQAKPFSFYCVCESNIYRSYAHSPILNDGKGAKKPGDRFESILAWFFLIMVFGGGAIWLVSTGYNQLKDKPQASAKPVANAVQLEPSRNNEDHATAAPKPTEVIKVRLENSVAGTDKIANYSGVINESDKTLTLTAIQDSKVIIQLKYIGGEGVIASLYTGNVLEAEKQLQRRRDLELQKDVVIYKSATGEITMTLSYSN